jgi:hypothetical protein
MRLLSPVFALILCSWLSAGDLAKINRAITKEPAYRSKPRYCLLVFGLEAKTRVWLVLDGDVLYVDRNSNGDLTEKGERVEAVRLKDLGWREFTVSEGIGQSKYKELVVLEQHPSLGKHYWGVSLTVEGKGRQGGAAVFAERPQDAPILHFDGRLTMLLGVWKLVRDQKDGQLAAHLVNQGVGKDVFTFLNHKAIPDNIHPIAEIEFPNKNPSGEPVKVKLRLTERC